MSSVIDWNSHIVVNGEIVNINTGKKRHETYTSKDIRKAWRYHKNNKLYD